VQAFRRNPALAATLLVAAGAGVGYVAAKPATGELEKVLYQASTTLIFVALLGAR